MVSANSGLADLGSLSSLTSVGGDLSIVDNNSVIDLHGLESLKTIGGDLEIKYNYALTTIAAFVKLRKVEGRLYIDENDELCDSEVDDLVRDLGHSTNYGDNDSGC